MGRIYVAAVVAAAAGGLLLAPLSLGGPIAHLGFSVVAVVRLLTTAAAFVSIRRRRIEDHRAWMVRSYALIFTAVTFRAWLLLLTALGLPVRRRLRGRRLGDRPHRPARRGVPAVGAAVARTPPLPEARRVIM